MGNNIKIRKNRILRLKNQVGQKGCHIIIQVQPPAGRGRGHLGSTRLEWCPHIDELRVRKEGTALVQQPQCHNFHQVLVDFLE